MQLVRDPLLDQLIDCVVENNINAIFAVREVKPFNVLKTSIHAEKVLSRELREILGKPFLELLPKHLQGEMEQLFKRVKRLHKARKLKSVIDLGAGEELHIDFHISFITMQEANFFLVQCHDHTDEILAAQEVERINMKLSRPTITDELTGLHNLRYLNERMLTEIKLANLTEDELSFILLDIDHFRHYNKVNGHEQGNEAIKALAKTIHGCIRSTFIAARYGGEEFGIVCPGLSSDEALELTDELKIAINNLSIKNAERQPLGFISASFGISSLLTKEDTPHDLYTRADEALYRSKRRGRNRASVHKEVEVVNEEGVQEQMILNEVSRILERKLF